MGIDDINWCRISEPSTVVQFFIFFQWFRKIHFWCPTCLTTVIVLHDLIDILDLFHSITQRDQTTNWTLPTLKLYFWLLVSWGRWRPSAKMSFSTCWDVYPTLFGSSKCVSAASRKMELPCSESTLPDVAVSYVLGCSRFTHILW